MYPEHFELSNLPMHCDTSKTFIDFTTKYHEAFMRKYSGMFKHKLIFFCMEHRCGKPGCGNVLVLDGNMKNHRNVCYADKAGYVQYEGLPGRLCTGCPNTPAYKSPYCNLHKPLISLPQHANSMNSDYDGNSLTFHYTEKKPVGLIIGKRATHNTTLYQASIPLAV